MGRDTGDSAVGWGVDGVPLCWPDYSLSRMSSHNKGFIITSWRVAAAWELCAAAFSARRPENVAQLRSFGRKVQRTTKPCIGSSLRPHKAASVSGGSESVAPHKPVLSISELVQVQHCKDPD